MRSKQEVVQFSMCHNIYTMHCFVDEDNIVNDFLRRHKSFALFILHTSSRMGFMILLYAIL